MPASVIRPGVASVRGEFAEVVQFAVLLILLVFDFGFVLRGRAAVVLFVTRTFAARARWRAAKYARVGATLVAADVRPALPASVR